MAKKKFNLSIDEQLLKDIKKLAVDMGINVNELIEKSIKAYAGWEDIQE